MLAFVVPARASASARSTCSTASRRVPGVAFAAVAVREDRERLRALVRERGWRVPVGYDHDGAVGNLLRPRRLPAAHVRRRPRGRVPAPSGFLDEPRWRTRRARSPRGGRCHDATRSSPPRRSTRPWPRSTRGCASGPRASRRGPGGRRPSCASGCGCRRPAARPQAVALRSRPCRGRTACSSATWDSTRTSRGRRSRRSSLDRLLHGGFAAGGMPDDALALAILETGVPVYARRRGPGRRAGARRGRRRAADARRRRGPSRSCSRRRCRDRAPGRTTRALLLVAIQAPAWTTCSSRRPVDGGRRDP